MVRIISIVMDPYSIYIVYIYIQLGLHITSEHQQVSMIDGGHGASGE